MADRYPYEFSGGQRQRIAIARAMVLKPAWWYSTSPPAQIVELLRGLQARHNLADLFVSHDPRSLRAMDDDLILMREGKVVEQGLAAAEARRRRKSHSTAVARSRTPLIQGAGHRGHGCPALPHDIFRLADLIVRGDAPIYQWISNGCTVMHRRVVRIFIGEQNGKHHTL
jgi:energy-coupling factor transporter ATP-binding protein EcfA2